MPKEKKNVVSPTKKPGASDVKEKHPGGRPTKYKQEYAEQAFKYCLLGATDSQLADFFNTSEQTINAWKKKHPKFLESIRDGKEKADAEIANSLYHRAKGYEHEDVHISTFNGEVIITPIVKHYPPDSKAITYWLNNRQKETWREKNITEHTGEDGGPIQVEASLPPEIEEIVQKITGKK